MGLEDFEGEDDGEDGNLGFELGPEDRAEMEREMLGMKRAIYEGAMDEYGAEAENDEGVEELQAMMLKMQAVRGEYLIFGLSLETNDHRSRHRYARSGEKEIRCEGSQ